MARPNHQFEKRQRELAKKKKKEEKRLRKLERKAETETADDETPDGEAVVASDSTGSEEPG
ncbi:MAG: hypothetical protein IID08_01705 [Candidatus Hydrogenedentes bacterium]|nr:hypothetical protein [Candidatus Hydrogenedentota bacterium]